MQYQTIGPDKLNQLRHARLLHDINDVEKHMEKLAGKLRPKFDAVLAELDQKLAGLGIAEWRKPNGGYFISLTVPRNCGHRVVELAKEAGLILTPAGAPFPYGKDPNDNVLRIAPTYPTLNELAEAAPLLCCCVKLAVLENEQNAQK
jgi:DNA-binding transcriptional MocR family regulator